MSKGKGSAFEREVCRMLSAWWSGGEADDWFWRASNSGGRATVRGKKGSRTTGHHGDIACTCTQGQSLTDFLTIECKRGYNRDTPFDMLDRLDGAATQTFEKWITQAKDASRLAHTFSWVLITRRDRRLPMIFFPRRLVNAVGITWTGAFDVTIGPEFVEEVHCTPLDTFFGMTRTEDVKKAARLFKRGGL